MGWAQLTNLAHPQQAWMPCTLLSYFHPGKKSWVGSVVLPISKGDFLLTAMGEGILSELTKKYMLVCLDVEINTYFTLFYFAFNWD